MACTAGTASASAQGQVMISTEMRDHQSVMDARAEEEIPGQAGAERRQMNDRRVKLRRPVDSRHIARARRAGRVDQPRGLVDQGGVARRRDPTFSAPSPLIEPA